MARLCPSHHTPLSMAAAVHLCSRHRRCSNARGFGLGCSKRTVAQPFTCCCILLLFPLPSSLLGAATFCLPFCQPSLLYSRSFTTDSSKRRTNGGRGAVCQSKKTTKPKVRKWYTCGASSRTPRECIHGFLCERVKDSKQLVCKPAAEQKGVRRKEKKRGGVGQMKARDTVTNARPWSQMMWHKKSQSSSTRNETQNSFVHRYGRASKYRQMNTNRYNHRHRHTVGGIIQFGSRGLFW